MKVCPASLDWPASQPLKNGRTRRGRPRCRARSQLLNFVRHRGGHDCLRPRDGGRKQIWQTNKNHNSISTRISGPARLARDANYAISAAPAGLASGKQQSGSCNCWSSWRDFSSFLPRSGPKPLVQSTTRTRRHREKKHCRHRLEVPAFVFVGRAFSSPPPNARPANTRRAPRRRRVAPYESQTSTCAARVSSGRASRERRYASRTR